MAIKATNQVKTVRGNKNLQLTAKTGESILVKDIRIAIPGDTYATLKIEKTTVGYFRVAGPLGNHLFWLPGITKPVKNVEGHWHRSFRLDASDGVQHIAVGDEVQRVRNGYGNPQPMFVFRGANGSGPVNAEVQTSDEIYPIVQYPSPQALVPNLLGWLIQKGYMKGYPVAEGETFMIEGVADDYAIQTVIYDIYDAEDIKPTDPNGSKADEYVFVQYGRPTNISMLGGTIKYDVCQTPPEFPDFPFAGVVPANTKMDLLGILFTDLYAWGDTGSDHIKTEYIKMIYQRQVLFDEDRNGLPYIGISTPFVEWDKTFGAGYSVGGNMSDTDMRLPFQTPEPISFIAGDEMNVYITLEGTGGGAPVNPDDVELGLIFKVSRVKP
jgi:hypothetical protein